jgi:hypothetical protein
MIVGSDTVLCDIYQNAVSNFHVLLYICIIKLQSCHFCHIRFLSFPEFGISFMATLNFRLVSKAHITGRHTFLAKLVRLTLQLQFNTLQYTIRNGVTTPPQPTNLHCRSIYNSELCHNTSPQPINLHCHNTQFTMVSIRHPNPPISTATQ